MILTASFMFLLLLCTPCHISAMSFVRSIYWDAWSHVACENKFLLVSNSSWRHRGSGKSACANPGSGAWNQDVPHAPLCRNLLRCFTNNLHLLLLVLFSFASLGKLGKLVLGMEGIEQLMSGWWSRNVRGHFAAIFSS